MPIGTGHPGVVGCASAGWPDAIRGDGGVLESSVCVGLRRWCVGRSPVGLGVRARLGRGGWDVRGPAGLNW